MNDEQADRLAELTPAERGLRPRWHVSSPLRPWWTPGSGTGQLA